MTMSQPLLCDPRVAPAVLANLVAESALRASQAFGEAMALHDASDTLLALAEETIERDDCPEWITARLLRLSDDYSEAGEQAGELCEFRHDVVQWLRQRAPFTAADCPPEEPACTATLPALRLISSTD